MRLQCPSCTTEFDLRPPGGRKGRARVQFRCTECGTMLGAGHLSLEDGEDSPSELPSVMGVMPELGAEMVGEPVGSGGILPFERPTDEVVQRFQAEMAEVEQELDVPEGAGALLKQDGKVYHVRSTAIVQRWIVERRVLRGDEISTGGMRWEAVGEHPDLEIFFKMVERLDELEQDKAEEHTTRPPLADSMEMGNAWSSDEQVGRVSGEHGMPMPEEEEEEEGHLSLDTVGEAESTEDPDSDISELPFALRSAGEPLVLTPATVSIAEARTVVEPPMSDGLLEMDALQDTEEAPPELQPEPSPALPVAIGPSAANREFDEGAFFSPEATQSSDRESTVSLPLIESGPGLAWEEDRAERRQRLGLIIGFLVILLLGVGVWYLYQEPAVAEVSAEGEQGAEPQADEQQAAKDQAAKEQAERALAAKEQAAKEQAAKDQAAKDQAESERAARAQAEKDRAQAEKDRATRAKTTQAPARERKPKPAASTAAGWDQVQAGDYNRARLIFVEQVADNPRDADAHFGLGYAAHKQGDDSTAIRHYCKALSLAPNNREIQQSATSLLSSLDGSCP